MTIDPTSVSRAIDLGATVTPRDPAAVLAAALPVLEAVEAYVEKVEDPRVFVDWHLYRDMRDAFYAFRASMEAGGPAGWRVGDDQGVRE